MKTETQIAKENVEDYLRVKKEELEVSPLHYLGLCNFHKATCQRFLEFLEEYEIEIGSAYGDSATTSITPDWLRDKITDLKQAIKLYEDARI